MGVAYCNDKVLAVAYSDFGGGGVVLFDAAARRRLPGAPLLVNEGQLTTMARQPKGDIIAASYVGSGAMPAWCCSTRPHAAGYRVAPSPSTRPSWKEWPSASTATPSPPPIATSAATASVVWPCSTQPRAQRRGRPRSASEGRAWARGPQPRRPYDRGLLRRHPRRLRRRRGAVRHVSPPTAGERPAR